MMGALHGNVYTVDIPPLSAFKLSQTPSLTNPPGHPTDTDQRNREHRSGYYTFFHLDLASQPVPFNSHRRLWQAREAREQGNPDRKKSKNTEIWGQKSRSTHNWAEGVSRATRCVHT
ncbi:uncharacterized protein MCYG_04134 [Microsporum canis CBS 113480]|uniref:Uncharacterized protein n=1 Tax=Arthroderma otae (strain ATCC MYA-4605 / CBS 113480) TaxID=554155 RepID=C5FN79_ARTOC|nr:uncharacterized protein MCYG_04134 [Microsporum canis CBS 113480]EEQ31315.1 predicted protein [Microsporum canis CBS 113480]